MPCRNRQPKDPPLVAATRSPPAPQEREANTRNAADLRARRAALLSCVPRHPAPRRIPSADLGLQLDGPRRSLHSVRCLWSCKMGGWAPALAALRRGYLPNMGYKLVRMVMLLASNWWVPSWMVSGVRVTSEALRRVCCSSW